MHTRWRPLQSTQAIRSSTSSRTRRRRVSRFQPPLRLRSAQAPLLMLARARRAKS
jgi:hypothetical protein